MLYIFIAILMFGILIGLHEFGHFIAAKLCGVKVNEFAIGMGPLIVHKQGKETEYSLRLLPIGGYCAMEGEEEGESDDPLAFPNRPWWQRLIILLAGVTMNFLTGFLIILLIFSGGEAFLTPTVDGYLENSAAQTQGLEIGDRIVRLDGHAIFLKSDIDFFISRTAAETVDLVVERAGTQVSLPGYRLNENRRLGISAGYELKTAGTLLKNSWYQAIDYVRLVWISLGDLVTGAVGLRDMSGPVGIIGLVGDAGEQGAAAAEAVGESALWGALRSIFTLVAFISINLSVMNLLPIPALDGGQIFFLAVNGILLALRGRKLEPKYQGWVSMIGFAALMAFMLVVTVSDILKKFGV